MMTLDDSAEVAMDVPDAKAALGAMTPDDRALARLGILDELLGALRGADIAAGDLDTFETVGLAAGLLADDEPNVGIRGALQQLHDAARAVASGGPPHAAREAITTLLELTATVN